MDTSNQDNKSKNRRYILNYRNKQKALGRRARLIYVTDDEYENIKASIHQLREFQKD